MVLTRSQSKWSDADIIRRYKALGKAASFTNSAKLAGELGLRVDRVRKAISKDIGILLHSKVRKKFRRRKVIALPFQTHSLDLKDLSSISQYNQGVKFLLFCIDVASKFLYVKPLKSKKAKEVATALESIYEHMKRKNVKLPRKIFFDRGREFDNKTVKALLKKYSISFYMTSDPETKASTVERSIKTITEMIYRYFTVNSTFRYTHILQRVVETYNNTVHSSHRLKPAEITVRDSDKVWRRLYEPGFVKTSPKFEKGQLCLIAKLKNTFEKGYTPGFRKETFKIDQVLDTNPVTYRLIDSNGEVIEGSFYESELVAKPSG